MISSWSIQFLLDPGGGLTVKAGPFPMSQTTRGLTNGEKRSMLLESMFQQTVALGAVHPDTEEFAP